MEVNDIFNGKVTGKVILVSIAGSAGSAARNPGLEHLAACLRYHARVEERVGPSKGNGTNVNF